MWQTTPPPIAHPAYISSSDPVFAMIRYPDGDLEPGVAVWHESDARSFWAIKTDDPEAGFYPDHREVVAWMPIPKFDF